MIGVICDSGTDLPEEILKDPRLKMVPLKVILGDKEYKDVLEIGEEEVLSYMEDDFPKTSLPSQNDVKSAMLKMIDDGFDEIVGVNISSALSGTHNVFRMASESVKKEFPAVKIELIDSLNISIGSGFLAYKALQLIDAGKKFEDMMETLKSSIKKSKLFYSIPTLKFLKAGGRIGRVSATLGEILNLKPVISVGDDGIYYTVAKGRGMQRAVDKMIQEALGFAQGKEVEVVGVYRTGDEEKTMELVNKIMGKVKTLKAPKILTGKVTASLLVHVGRGLVGLGILTK